MIRQEDVDAMQAAYRSDIREAWAMHRALTERVMAAIVEVIAESGAGSPQHLRLRHALCGSGPGSPSAAAVKQVRNRFASAADEPGGRDLGAPDALAAQRYNALHFAIPNDPRGWWTGDEADDFVRTWQSLALPHLRMGDGQGDHYLFWCSDAARASEMLGVDLAEDGGFTISKGEYSVSIVQADKKKETKDA